MPSRDAFLSVDGWRCPLCRGTTQAPVVIERPGKPPYKTEFSYCVRCTVMFLDPNRFTRLGVPIQRHAGDIGPKALEEAQHYWRDM